MRKIERGGGRKRAVDEARQRGLAQPCERTTRFGVDLQVKLDREEDEGRIPATPALPCALRHRSSSLLYRESEKGKQGKEGRAVLSLSLSLRAPSTRSAAASLNLRSGGGHAREDRRPMIHVEIPSNGCRTRM